ncbi:hypothetical protein OHS33_02135 [Streptomyces sp. NBC_00536]|uniref:hypothetical protein n=1 Tax=Streptomyces sp. NBC_00536 TaxID=2975769 RepID=UPI002E7FFDB0|nr:hypothetical protein [Streptomyces sp. NBC_00536]WUC77253.1 hypothetical protein OHS33_02135 [Streptomyces sp. NBC_00536]
MTSDAALRTRRPSLRNVTTAGSALAVALLPLVVGVLVAKGMAADPHTPVNALITGGGQRAGIPRAEWRRRGHQARTTLRRLRPAALPAPPARTRGRAARRSAPGAR